MVAKIVRIDVMMIRMVTRIAKLVIWIVLRIARMFVSIVRMVRGLIRMYSCEDLKYGAYHIVVPTDVFATATKYLVFAGKILREYYQKLNRYFGTNTSRFLWTLKFLRDAALTCCSNYF